MSFILIIVYYLYIRYPISEGSDKNLLVHHQHFVEILAAVAETRNLMLATQLALALEPIVEDSRSCLYYFQMLERNVVESLSLIVAVDFLQFPVEQAGKLVQAFRFLGEFDKPLMAALGVAVHIDRSSRIFSHLGTRLLAGISQTLLGIIHNQFLAKGIDEVLGSAGNDKLIWILACKLNGITNHVTP